MHILKLGVYALKLAKHALNFSGACSKTSNARPKISDLC